MVRDRGPLGQAGWRWVRRRAQRLARNPARLQSLLDHAELKPRHALGTARDQLATLMRLLRAWLSSDYRELPLQAVIAATGAVLYFFLPLDLIPDFLPGIGFVDDIAVILWASRQLAGELDRFRAWETGEDRPPP